VKQIGGLGRVLWRLLRVSLLSLVVAEVFLRFVRPVDFAAPPDPDFLPANDQMLYRRSAVPGLLYEIRPSMPEMIIGSNWVKTNSQGMRDRELLAADTPGLTRIAVLGDSFAFGFGVTLDETFTEVLEVQLNAAGDGRRYEVLNFGVPGYSTEEEAAVLEHKALAFDPKVVVVAYVLNDPETEPMQPLHVFFSPVRWWQHLHLLRLGALLSITAEVNRYGGGNYVRYLHAGPKWRSAAEALARIRSLTEARDLPVLVVLFPLVEESDWAEYPYRAVHAQVAAEAAAAGLGALDLLPIYERYPPARIGVFPEDHHPSKLAHRLAAEAIAARLRQQGWLPARAS
jgi:lysophospholipase L1-like esterase